MPSFRNSNKKMSILLKNTDHLSTPTMAPFCEDGKKQSCRHLKEIEQLKRKTDRRSTHYRYTNVNGVRFSLKDDRGDRLELLQINCLRSLSKVQPLIQKKNSLNLQTTLNRTGKIGKYDQKIS